MSKDKQYEEVDVIESIFKSMLNDCFDELQVIEDDIENVQRCLEELEYRQQSLNCSIVELLSKQRNAVDYVRSDK